MFPPRDESVKLYEIKEDQEIQEAWKSRIFVGDAWQGSMLTMCASCVPHYERQSNTAGKGCKG